MTERIRALRALIVEKKAHHAFRRAADIDPAPYRRGELRDFQRTALRLKTFLEAETPVILPGERIAGLRTLPDLPGIYGEEEWTAIKAAHYIHEQGRVCNLSPDYEKIIRKGLLGVLQDIDAADAKSGGANALYYDAMLGKMIVWAPDREEAIRKMDAALCEIIVDGVSTNIESQLDIVRSEGFRRGDYHTLWLQNGENCP